MAAEKKATEKKKGRRSPAPGGRPYTAMVALSEREMEQVAGMAASEGLAVGAWLGEVGVRAATQGRDSAATDPIKGLRELMVVHVGLVGLGNQLRSAGVNLNQVARYANGTGALPAQTAMVQALVARRVQQVDNALVELRRLIALARPPHGATRQVGGRRQS